MFSGILFHVAPVAIALAVIPGCGHGSGPSACKQSRCVDGGSDSGTGGGPSDADAAASGGSANGGSAGGGASGVSGGAGCGCEPIDAGLCSQGVPCDHEGTTCVEDVTRSCFCTGSEWSCSRNEPTSTEQALTGAYVGRDNQACLACAQANCKGPTGWPCEWSGSPTGCLRLLDCELNSQCARSADGVIACYCGDSKRDGGCLYADGANGPCRAEEEQSDRTPEGVLTHFLDPSRLIVANALSECLAENCASCFRSDRDDACPSVTAFRVDPSPAAVGASMSVTALAVDDGRPSALRYLWTADVPDVGVFGDAHAASTEFTCMKDGDATLTLTVSDGNPACDFSLSRGVSCARADCTSFFPIVATAVAAFVPDSINLKTNVVDTDGMSDKLSYSWSVAPSTHGTLSQNDAPTDSYSCVSPGVATVTVTSSEPHGSCHVQQSIGLTCVAASAPSASPDTTQSALTGAYAGRDNQACWSCATKNHCVSSDSIQPCEFREDPSERALCLRLLQCELESGCASSVGSCYCQHTDNCFTAAGAADGVCASELQAAFASTDANFIGFHFMDLAFPGGPANVLTRCLSDQGCTACFP